MGSRSFLTEPGALFQKSGQEEGKPAFNECIPALPLCCICNSKFLLCAGCCGIEPALRNGTQWGGDTQNRKCVNTCG